jgi:hypothetical protein
LVEVFYFFKEELEEELGPFGGTVRTDDALFRLVLRGEVGVKHQKKKVSIVWKKEFFTFWKKKQYRLWKDSR